MDKREETYDDHRKRDEKTWGSMLLISWFFPSFRWLWLPLLIAVGGAWMLNVLGDSGALDRQEPGVVRYYSNVDRNGKMFLTEGCRQERKLPDGSCDRTIVAPTITKNFPFFGEAKQVAK